uniref:Uncharacterized protein n=1 Tax=Alexandrium monilatum TaxID=311494 RepID=A0A7S4SZJ9_9DINO
MYQNSSQQYPPQHPQQYQPGQMAAPGIVMGTPVPEAGDIGKMPVSQVPPEVRNGFVRKVYSLLSVQLMVTFGIALYMNTQLTPLWVAKHLGIYYMASFGTLAMMLGVSCCCADALRNFPFNYAFLAALTIGMSITVGFATVLYTTDSVLLALGTTAGVFLVLTAYACLTTTDFTGIGPYLFAGLIALMMFGFVISIFSWLTGTPMVGSMVHKLYAGCGVLLFVFYIIYDTQLIVGGEHKKQQFAVDDYVFATIELYLDVINLFVFLLELMGDRR